MPASDVLPRPGGPANSRWSTGCARRRAASMTMCRCSVSWACPTNSSRCRGRSRTSSAAPRGRAGASTGRRRRHRRRCRDEREVVPRAIARPRRAAEHLAARAHRAPRQLAQRAAQQLLDGTLLGDAVEGTPDLVGPVAELAERGPDLAARPATPGAPGNDPVAESSGSSSRTLSSSTRRAAVLRPTPGTAHSASTSSSSTAAHEVRRAKATTGRPGPATVPPRGRRAAPRSSAARRRGEPVQHDGVLAHVGVHVELDVGAPGSPTAASTGPGTNTR